MKITDLEINEYNVKSAPDTLRAEGNVTARDIKHIFDRLPEYTVRKFNAFVDYVTGNFYTKQQTDSAIAQRVKDIGSADMQKAVYDSNNNGVVDRAENADSLGGQSAEYYAAKTDVEQVRQTAEGKADAEHTQSADTVSAGTFTGDVMACSDNRATGCLRNIEVRITDTAGDMQSTNKIVCVRK